MQGWRGDPRPAGRRPPRPLLAQRDDLLDGPHGQPLGDDAGGEPVLRIGILQRQQRPGVAGREHAGCHPSLHGRRQPQQSDHVGDVGAGAPELPGEFLVGGAEVAQELLVGGRFLQRVELLAVQVLQQGVAQHGVVGGVSYDGGDLAEARELGRPPAPFAHDQLVASGHDLADDDGLEQADLTQARGQLLQGVLVEVRPRLAGVRRHRVDRDLPEGGAVDGRRPDLQPETVIDARADPAGALRPGRDQCSQAASQPTPARGHTPTPFGSKPRSASSRAAAR